VSNRRSHLILIGLIVAALVGVALLAVPGSPARQKPTLGLDLQGGLEVVLQAKPEKKGRKLTKSDLDRSVSIMRNRVDKLGVSEPEIRKQGDDQIVIELPGVHNPERAADIIGKTAKLEFFDLEADLTDPSISADRIFPRATPSLYQLLARQQLKVTSAKEAPETWYLFDKRKRVVVGPAATRADLLKSKLVKRNGGEVPKGFKIFAVPPGTVVVTCSRKTAVVCPADQNQNPQPLETQYYLFKYDPDNPKDDKRIPEMTGGDLKLSGTRSDIDPQQGPIVLMQFTGHGADQFHEITRREAQRGSLVSGRQGTKLDQHFAIVLDREIKSFPSIDFDQYPDGISGNTGAQITGLDSLGEAKDLALVLQTGALPVEFRTIERTDVSATLGQDSLDQAKKAAFVGLLVVALFLLLVYRFLGLVAVIGLGIYAAFLYAAILILNVTLTLPGFAGLILTIGVAADANVVVFERIKEEVRAGKSVRAGIAAGYGKGFHTIVDANVVTLITAFVLFAVATAGVKGFALMLIIGTLLSLVTAVAATRAMLGMLAGFRWFENPRFMGAQGQQGLKWLQIDYMGRRYLWFAISGAIIVIGLVSLGVKGLNLGIDFKGGTQVTFKTPEPVSLSSVREQAAAIGQSGSVIQGRGRQFGTDSYENFQIRTKSLSPVDQTKLTKDLIARFGESGENLNIGVKNVSSSFGRQIARAALLATFFSLFLIVLYISIRFQFKFALPVIAALIHDIVITVGVYSLTGREVTTSTVAAVLTVLGYSIYDTIIIFDRIRENMPLMRRSSFATIANVSLWETIRRSLATSFITLLPVGSLLLFGGDTLKDFAFALLVGIASGAYSSIFIAAPLLTMWKEREPEYARRRGADGGPPTDGDAQRVLEEAQEAAADEPVPALAPLTPGERSSAQGKRERRRQRRRARPHGRAR
jgi:SecD/SecF fusion protein